MGMCRIADMEKALAALSFPEGEGTVTLEIQDDFLPSNSGIYKLSWNHTGQTVVRQNDAPDMIIGIEAASQLISGYAAADELEFAGKAQILSNRELLTRIFTHKKNYIIDQF